MRVGSLFVEKREKTRQNVFLIEKKKQNKRRRIVVKVHARVSTYG